MSELFLRSSRVVTAQGVRPAAIAVAAGRITEVLEPHAIPADAEVHDYRDLVIMPGMVDTHVHVNEPGRTEWEGFDTATRAAAAGGVTTLVDMPLNSIPATIDVAAFVHKQQAARGQCWVDTGFWGGLVAGNIDQLDPLARAGVLGFKAFLVPSGVPEFSAASLDDVRAALPILRGHNLPLLVHAELPEPIDAATTELQKAAADPCAYECYLASRPPEAETQAIAALIALAETARAHVHIVHLAAAQALPMLSAARKRGVPITIETCPHYLYFSSDEIPAGGTEFKCAPPIRDADNRDHLVQALEDGIIDFVVSDHSPCEPALKTSANGDFFRAWGGIASLQLRLPVVLDVFQRRGFSFARLTRWLATEPARLAGLEGRKGLIAQGFDADFVVWDPASFRTIESGTLLHRHKLSPYTGRTLPGLVHATYLRGSRIYDGRTVLGEPSGQLLLQPDSA